MYTAASFVESHGFSGSLPLLPLLVRIVGLQYVIVLSNKVDDDDCSISILSPIWIIFVFIMLLIKLKNKLFYEHKATSKYFKRIRQQIDSYRTVCSYSRKCVDVT